MNPFIRYDQRLEDFVRSYVKANFPSVNQSGFISGTMSGGSLSTAVAHNRENGSIGGKELFVWGTTHFGSYTHVIAQ